MRQMIAGIAHMHSKLTVHRDIKLENVLFFLDEDTAAYNPDVAALSTSAAAPPGSPARGETEESKDDADATAQRTASTTNTAGSDDDASSIASGPIAARGRASRGRSRKRPHYTLKIVDFGLGCLIKDRDTKLRVQCGSLLYVRVDMLLTGMPLIPTGDPAARSAST